MTTYCCDVTRPVAVRLGRAGPGQDGADPEICDGHRADGWGVFPGARGPEIDKIRRLLCGCLFQVIAGKTSEKCALHSIGWRACCVKATRTRCVCAESYDCPEHGSQCYGTHD